MRAAAPTDTRERSSRMKRIVVTTLFLLSSVVLVPAEPVQSGDAKTEQKKKSIRESVQETLTQLHETQPSAKKAVKRAYGYAVFNNFGMKILLLGGGKGRGMAVENKTGKETFMKMAEAQAGLGMGVKKFSLVWVFKTQSAFDNFVTSGWQFGGQATAAAKTPDEGGALAGAINISPDIWLYQLTDKGLALEITAKGTKYYQDKKLNK